MLKIASFLFLLLPLVVNGAGVKKWVDENGVVHFGDIPSVGIKAESVPVKPLSVGQGLSSKQMRLSKELEKRDKAALKSKFKAEKKAAEKLREQQKIAKAYRKGRLIKGLTMRQVRRLLGEPDSIEKEKTKKGQNQKWRYENVKAGEPEVVYIKNGFYSRHRSKKPGKR